MSEWERRFPLFVEALQTIGSVVAVTLLAGLMLAPILLLLIATARMMLGGGCR